MASHAIRDRQSPFSTTWDTQGANIITAATFAQSCQDLALQKGRDIVRVYRMGFSQRSKGRKGFERLVDEPSTWIAEDQLETSLSPTLLAYIAS